VRGREVAIPSPHRYGRAIPLAVYAVLAAGIGLSAWLHLRGFQRDLQQRVERELSWIADIKVGELVAWRDQQEHEWSELRTKALVATSLGSAVAGDRAQDTAGPLAEALEATRAQLEAEAVLVLDARAEVVLALPAGARPSDGELGVARRALRASEPFLDEGAPGDGLVVAVPLGPPSRGRGVLLARYDMARAVSGMVLGWPHPASTAEPVLVRRDGEFIVPVTTPLHTKVPRLPLTMDIPTTRAVKGTVGIVECNDYRGVPVIAALRRVPGSSWYLSVKVDRAEVFAPGRQQAILFGVVTLVLLTLAGGSVWFWWRAQVSAIDRRAHEMEEQALRRRFDALWSQANDIVMLFEPSGCLMEANQRALEAYGYTRDELRLLRLQDLRATETLGLVPGQLGQVLTDGALRFETAHRRKDGRIFPVEVSAARLESPAGPLVLSVIRDISDRLAAAAAARYQATLLENLNDGVIGLDRAMRITAWAGAAQRIYGYSPEEALGAHIAGLLGGELPDATFGRIAGEIARAGRCQLEVRNARKDGRSVDIEITSVAIRDGLGEVVGFVEVHRDIGERKRAEAEQRRLESELVFADRLASIGTLAAGVAHEINNPLSFLLANLEYLKGGVGAGAGEDDADRGEALREASDGARRIAEIVRGLRAFGRRDGGSSPGAVDVRKAVNAAANMVQAQARPRARLVMELGETPPVFGKEHEVAQVVLNLVINAIQAVPEGRPDDHEVRVSTRVGDDGFVELKVRDTGAGIPPENLDRIYDPFFTTKEVGEGSGLGLSVCLGIVRAMGGTIEAESAVGRGSTFTVRLPAGSAAEEHPAPPRALRQRRARILVLDDEPMVCAAVRRSLEPEHEVVTMSDPRAALDRLARGDSYDVVLCDLLMPHTSGMDCFEELSRHRPELARRMVFLTGGAVTPRGRKFMDDNRARCIEKPFHPDELKARVAEVVERFERDV
jgi:PAS domain S-box-containing protein